MNLNRLHVMFGMGYLADHYNQHVGVAITSLAMNCSLQVTVHLLYDENLHKGSQEYLDNQEKYPQMEKHFGIEIFSIRFSGSTGDIFFYLRGGTRLRNTCRL